MSTYSVPKHQFSLFAAKVKRGFDNFMSTMVAVGHTIGNKMQQGWNRFINWQPKPWVTPLVVGAVQIAGALTISALVIAGLANPISAAIVLPFLIAFGGLALHRAHQIHRLHRQLFPQPAFNQANVGQGLARRLHLAPRAQVNAHAAAPVNAAQPHVNPAHAKPKKSVRFLLDGIIKKPGTISMVNDHQIEGHQPAKKKACSRRK